jgi:hypothetical protein
MYRVLKPGGTIAMFHPAGKDFLYELFNVFRQFLGRHREFIRLGEVLDEYGEMHDSLEDFQNMAYGLGFTGMDFFGRYVVEYVNPERYLNWHPYPVDWLLSIPEGFRSKARLEILGDMLRFSEARGFKSTRYFIQGSARKPL